MQEQLIIAGAVALYLVIGVIVVSTIAVLGDIERIVASDPIGTYFAVVIWPLALIVFAVIAACVVPDWGSLRIPKWICAIANPIGVVIPLVRRLLKKQSPPSV